MKKLTLTLLIGIMLFVSVGNVFAVSESAVLFLLISPGARAAGMGEAFVAIADDASAAFWNPAGLGFQTGREVTLMHANWLPGFGSDLFYDFGAYKHHVEGLGTFGLNVTYLNLGEQVYTAEDSPTPLGTFTSNEYAISGTFGTKLSENWSVGIGMRYIRSNLAPSNISVGAEKGDGSGSAFAFDVATLYKTPFLPKLSLGLNLSNMGPKITYIDAAQADPLPTNLKVGLAYKVVDDEFNKLTVVADLNKLMVTRHNDETGSSDPFYQALFTSPWTEKKPIKYDEDDNPVEYETVFKGIISGGAEYWYNNMIALRAGYYWDQDGKVNFVSLGAGIKYDLYGFDFAYVSADEGHPLSNTMRFSLSMGF